MAERPYLSIGEVLGLLLEEFPDVTISKIRFLESQGLIDPERTPSGYRKFYDGDVERLRVILREQRENFLPLRVIRDRLESGVIESDPSGPITPPRGIRNVTAATTSAGAAPTAVADASVAGATDSSDDWDDSGPYERPHTPQVPSANHPAAQVRLAAPPVMSLVGSHTESAPATTAPAPASARAATSAPVAERKIAVSAPVAAVSAPAPAADPAPAPAPARHASSDAYVAGELCKEAGITEEQLLELESFGLVAGKGAGRSALYTAADVAVATAAAGFLAHGVGGRHLRAWRQAADREAALYEQLILPLLRQRNPQARQQALDTLQSLTVLGGELRSAIVHASLRHHLES